MGYVCLIAIAGILSYGAISRYFFHRALTWTDEVAVNVIVPLVAIPMAYVFSIRGHVRVDLVVRLLRPRMQRYLGIICELLTIVFLSIVSIELCRLTLTHFHTDRRFIALWSWPLWPVEFLAFLGLSLTVVYLVGSLIVGLSKNRQ